MNVLNGAITMPRATQSISMSCSPRLPLAGAAAVAEREVKIDQLDGEITKLQEALAAAQAGGEAEVAALREKLKAAEDATAAGAQKLAEEQKKAKTALEEE